MPQRFRVPDSKGPPCCQRQDPPVLFLRASVRLACWPAPFLLFETSLINEHSSYYNTPNKIISLILWCIFTTGRGTGVGDFSEETFIYHFHFWTMWQHCLLKFFNLKYKTKIYFWLTNVMARLKVPLNTLVLASHLTVLRYKHVLLISLVRC